MTQGWSQPGVLVYDPRVVTAWSAGVWPKGGHSLECWCMAQGWSQPGVLLFDLSVVTAWNAVSVLYLSMVAVECCCL